jgi:hypothetical protein
MAPENTRIARRVGSQPTRQARISRATAVPAFGCLSFHTNDATRSGMLASKDNLKSGPGRNPQGMQKTRAIGRLSSCLARWGALSPWR